MTKTSLMFVILDIAELLSSERLQQRIPLGASCMEIAGSDGIRSSIPIFFPIVWFKREWHKTLLSVATMGHYLFHGEVRGGECHAWKLTLVKIGPFKSPCRIRKACAVCDVKECLVIVCRMIERAPDGHNPNGDILITSSKCIAHASYSQNRHKGFTRLLYLHRVY
jgi:hypothetical protein